MASIRVVRDGAEKEKEPIRSQAAGPFLGQPHDPFRNDDDDDEDDDEQLLEEPASPPTPPPDALQPVPESPPPAQVPQAVPLVFNNHHAIPAFLQRFKCTYTASDAYTKRKNIYRLVQAHFSLPMSLLEGGDVAYRSAAETIWDFLIARFKLSLPSPSLEAGQYQIVAVPQLQYLDNALDPIYWQGTFNLSAINDNNSSELLSWRRLESPREMAASLRLALDEDNIYRTMVKRFRGSNYLFVRLCSVIVAVCFLDASSFAGLEAVKKTQEHWFD